MSSVLIDTNVFLYYFFQSIEQEKLQLIENLFYKIENKYISGVITTRILDEVYFKIIIAKAKEIYPKNTIKKLKNDKELLKNISIIYDKVNEVVEVFDIKIKNVTYRDFKRLKFIQKNYGLIGNDAISLSIILREKIDYIATFDKDFSQVPIVSNYFTQVSHL
jgi:predicted nucleic acid-binding protein